LGLRLRSLKVLLTLKKLIEKKKGIHLVKQLKALLMVQKAKNDQKTLLTKA
jgi:hypothetical protein